MGGYFYNENFECTSLFILLIHLKIFLLRSLFASISFEIWPLVKPQNSFLSFCINSCNVIIVSLWLNYNWLFRCGYNAKLEETSKYSYRLLIYTIKYHTCILEKNMLQAFFYHYILYAK